MGKQEARCYFLFEASRDNSVTAAVLTAPVSAGRRCAVQRLNAAMRAYGTLTHAAMRAYGTLTHHGVILQLISRPVRHIRRH